MPKGKSIKADPGGCGRPIFREVFEIAADGKDDKEMSVSNDAFDNRSDLVGLDNGKVINLRTGTTRPGEPEDMVYKTLARGGGPAIRKSVKCVKKENEGRNF